MTVSWNTTVYIYIYTHTHTHIHTVLMSFVQSSVEFERCCEFSKLGDGHVIDAQKPYCVSSGNRAASFEV